MSIEIGSKWVKDGEVVKVKSLILFDASNSEGMCNKGIVFLCENKIIHVLTERDFLEQYKPYVTYKYKWVYMSEGGIYFSAEIMTEEEFKKCYLGGGIEEYKPIIETRQEA